MPLPRFAALCIGLSCSFLPAQEGAVLKDLADAEAALAQRRPEDAALAVQSAVRRLRLVTDPTLRGELEPRVVALRDKADPVAKTAEEAAKEGAAALVAAAKSYEDRGWLRSARDLLVRAAELSPAVADEALQRVRGRLSGGDAAPSGEGLLAIFGGGEAVDGADEWVVEPTSLTVVPPSTSLHTTRYLGGRRVNSDRIRMQCRVPRESPYGIGLVFAYRHGQDFHVATVRPSNGKWFARISLASGGTYTNLAEEWLPAVPQPQPGQTAPPLEIALAVDGTAVRFVAAGVELKTTLAAPLRPGFLGVQAEHTGPGGPGTRLGDFAVEAEVQR